MLLPMSPAASLVPPRVHQLTSPASAAAVQPITNPPTHLAISIKRSPTFLPSHRRQGLTPALPQQGRTTTVTLFHSHPRPRHVTGRIIAIPIFRHRTLRLAATARPVVVSHHRLPRIPPILVQIPRISHQHLFTRNPLPPDTPPLIPTSGHPPQPLSPTPT